MPETEPTTLPATQGSEAAVLCLNCGKTLAGPYCYYCGQPDKNIIRFFPALMREFLAEIVDFDSRFSRTMTTLLFKPGKLSAEYIAGKRFRYTPPIRLYLFSSLIAFLMFTLMINLSDLTEGVTDGLSESENSTKTSTSQPTEPATDATESEDSFEIVVFGAKPWDKDTNPVNIPLAPQRLNDWINDELGKANEKTERIKQDPKIIVNEIVDMLPGTMFIMLPIFALVLKLFYLFARRYYIEHLIFALHNHAFIYVMLIIIGPIGMIEEQLDGGWVDITLISLVSALFVWIPIYLLIAMKRVYGQGWILTLLKYFSIGLAYFIILVIAATIVAMLSLLLI